MAGVGGGTLDLQISAQFFCKLKVLFKNSLLILKICKTYLKEILQDINKLREISTFLGWKTILLSLGYCNLS